MAVASAAEESWHPVGILQTMYVSVRVVIRADSFQPNCVLYFPPGHLVHKYTLLRYGTRLTCDIGDAVGDASI